MANLFQSVVEICGLEQLPVERRRYLGRRHSHRDVIDDQHGGVVHAREPAPCQTSKKKKHDKARKSTSVHNESGGAGLKRLLLPLRV